MSFQLAVFFAAASITTLETAEAATLALYGESKKSAAFLYVGSGSTAVPIPTFLLGKLIISLTNIRVIGVLLPVL